MSREGISHDDLVDNAQVFHLDQKPVLRMVRAAPPDPVFAMDGFLSNHPWKPPGLLVCCSLRANNTMLQARSCSTRCFDICLKPFSLRRTLSKVTVWRMGGGMRAKKLRRRLAMRAAVRLGGRWARMMREVLSCRARIAWPYLAKSALSASQWPGAMRLSAASGGARLPQKGFALRSLGGYSILFRRCYGSEFSCHFHLHNLALTTFFCDTHSPWQKGGIENAIGRIRRFLPRNTDLATISDQQFNALIAIYNHTPRKCLDFQTPAEVFCQQLLHFECESTCQLSLA